MSSSGCGPSAPTAETDGQRLHHLNKKAGSRDEKRAAGLYRLLDGGGELEYNKKGIKSGRQRRHRCPVPPLGIDLGRGGNHVLAVRIA